MGEMLSQEEINALLRGLDFDEPASSKPSLTDEEKDAIGEISNISMGTAATTLYTLLNNKVTITIPNVEVAGWDDISDSILQPCVTVLIEYKEGLQGTNLLVLKEKDVKIISDLMMGGDGSNTENELTELHLSAIGEAMNQMIGSAATSMSSIFKRKIDIMPPIATALDITAVHDASDVAPFLAEYFIKVEFRLEIGDLIDSEFFQLYPMSFAKMLFDSFEVSRQEPAKAKAKEEPAKNVPNNDNNNQSMGMNGMYPGMNGMGMQPGMNGMGMQPGMNGMGMQPGMNGMGMQPGMNGMGMQPGMMNGMGMGMQPGMNGMYGNFPPNQGMQRNVEVQPVQFQTFDMGSFVQQKENIDLIMDVQLEVTVELGRTHKSIREILELSPGSIIELNKLAGEPIDVLVNQKLVAKGEVVVIDENFSIRITDIIKTPIMK